MGDVVQQFRSFVEAWLSRPVNCEIIHGINGQKITTDHLTQAADEIEALRAENARLREVFQPFLEIRHNPSSWKIIYTNVNGLEPITIMVTKDQFLAANSLVRQALKGAKNDG